jgi:hypothetical protein
MSVVVGLFGGFVYVNGFRMIKEGVGPEHAELATAAGAVSVDIGVVTGETVGIFIQRYLYMRNGISER